MLVIQISIRLTVTRKVISQTPSSIQPNENKRGEGTNLANLLRIQPRPRFCRPREPLDPLGIDEAVDKDVCDVDTLWTEFARERLERGKWEKREVSVGMGWTWAGEGRGPTWDRARVANLEGAMVANLAAPPGES